MGPVSARAKFGGAGLYLDGTMFALIKRNDVLYFRTDDRNRADDEAAGTEPFVTFPDKAVVMPTAMYHPKYWKMAIFCAPEPASAGKRRGVQIERKAREGSGTSASLSVPFTTEPLSWDIRPNDPKLLDRLNQFLNEVKVEVRFGITHMNHFTTRSRLAS